MPDSSTSRYTNTAEDLQRLIALNSWNGSNVFPYILVVICLLILITQGRIMNRIEVQVAAKSACLRLCGDRSPSEPKGLLHAQTVRFSDRIASGVAADPTELHAQGIVNGLVDGKTIYPREALESSAKTAERNSARCVSDTLLSSFEEQAREELYSKREVPTDWLDSEAHKGDVVFLDHALGFTPPAALCQAVKKMFVLQQAGSNVMWQTIFSEVIPQASR